MKKMFFELTSSSKKKKEKIEKKIELEEKEVKIERKSSSKSVKVKELLKDSELRYIESQYQIKSNERGKGKKKDWEGDYVVCTFLDTVVDHDDVDLSWLEQGQGHCTSCTHTKNAGLREYFEKRR